MNKEETTQRVEILEFIFENVNNWVHFAEAKSAMIIALYSGSVVKTKI